MKEKSHIILQEAKMNGHFSKLKNWLNENLLLILTFSGVVIGINKEDLQLDELHSI